MLTAAAGTRVTTFGMPCKRKIDAHLWSMNTVNHAGRFSGLETKVPAGSARSSSEPGLIRRRARDLSTTHVTSGARWVDWEAVEDLLLVLDEDHSDVLGEVVAPQALRASRPDTDCTLGNVAEVDTTRTAVEQAFKFHSADRTAILLGTKGSSRAWRLAGAERCLMERCCGQSLRWMAH